VQRIFDSFAVVVLFDRRGMMSNLAELLERNRAFAASDGRSNPPRLPYLPHRSLYIVTCIDPRTDPALFLGLEFGDAVVARTAGGRVTPSVVLGVAYMSYLVETQAPEGPYFEVAVIHHTDCGTRLLEDEVFRSEFAERTAYDERALAGLPVADPRESVRADVERLLASPEISPRITVSGHVYDVETGLVSTVVEATTPVARLGLEGARTG
jgi:carbonic anhydrase